MNKINITGVDEEIFHEKLENNLNVYIYKKKDYLKKGAFFVVNYGSSTNEFVPIDENKMRSFPKGIAHFLEHKLFESNDNENTFLKFSKYGANVNAYTNHFITNYYFSCVSNFDECLNLLLDFVSSPHFTDSNVEKEKGIIKQEINMTNDDIDRFIFEELYNVSLVRNPNKYRTIGDKKNVSMITKEDLYKCYSTFYNPFNMVLVIYGDVNEKEVIKLVKENQKGKKFDNINNVEIKQYDEDEKVSSKYTVFKRNITVPKIGVCYKIKIPKYEGMDLLKESLFMSMFLEMKFSGSSSFEEDLLKKEIINDELEWTYTIFDDVILIFFIVSTNKKDEFLKILDFKIKDKNFDKKIFNLNKKAYLASIVKTYENPSEVATIIFNQYFKYNDVIDNIYDIYKDYSYCEFLEKTGIINLDNKAVVEIKNMEE